MFGGEAHDSIVGRGGVPDRSSDTVAAREGLVACARPRSRVVASIGPRRLCGRSASSRRLGRKLGARPPRRPRLCFFSRPKVTLMFTPSTRPRRDEGPLSILDAARRCRRARLWGLCGAAARPRPRAAPTCRRARTAPKLFRAPPRRRPRRGRERGRSSLVWLFAPRARPPRARAGLGPVLFSCFFRASLCVCFCDFVTL